jgi:hypothetical protein
MNARRKVSAEKGYRLVQFPRQSEAGDHWSPLFHSFTRRPVIAVTFNSKAASENLGGFFGAGES